MPLDTLKKEERRGKEEEGEEERERRRTIKRRERERGNSIVRSDNHLIVTEIPQLFSEVNDSSSLPVTEASLVVEASTVVNYDKKELAQLLESKEVSPGLVLVNYRPAMVKRRKVEKKKKAGIRRRVRVKARQKSLASQFSPKTTTHGQ